MIEIMCRDNSIPDEALEQIADRIGEETEEPITLLYVNDFRALAYWGVEDVMTSIKELELSHLDENNVKFCENIIEKLEPKIHQAMLEAGRKVLDEYLVALDEKLTAKAQ